MTNPDDIRRKADSEAWAILASMSINKIPSLSDIRIGMTNVIEKHLRRIAELEKEMCECTCTDPIEDPYGNLCMYCAYNSTLEAFKQQTATLDRYQRMFNRIKSICVGDGTFLTGAQIKIIEEQEQ